MREKEFINDLMHHIIEGVNIPKVQVERAIGPILSLFVEAILNKFFQNDTEYSGEYTLITPEFPLKKENNQSTNIDYLLYNSSKKFLLFFELKTDPSSLKKEQIEIYKYYKKEVSKSSANLMLNDLMDILNASAKKSKYDTIVLSFNSKIQNPKEIIKIKTLYLVPEPAVKKISKEDEIDFVLSFSDLPKTIDHKYAEYWTVIREHLITLDKHFKTKKSKSIEGDPIKVIVNNIHNYLSQSNENINPVSIQIGILGEGTQPNYQVKFEDGSIKTFRFSGKPHSVLSFKSRNLGEKQLWKDIKNLL